MIVTNHNSYFWNRYKNYKQRRQFLCVHINNIPRFAIVIIIIIPLTGQVFDTQLKQPIYLLRGSEYWTKEKADDMLIDACTYSQPTTELAEISKKIKPE